MVRGRRNRGIPRARTIAIADIDREELRRGAEENPNVDVERPKTWGDCQEESRPCPWVACREHLYLDVNPDTGSIKLNFPDLEPWELRETCALDVAARGGVTLDEVGALVNVTRERARQIEADGLEALNEVAGIIGITAEDAVFPHADGNHVETPAVAREESAKRARAAYKERQRVARESADETAEPHSDEAMGDGLAGGSR